ncbi:DUF349 domain-containing protein [Myroides ceti]|uniref:DUF349 domain-containing protein n=1 Tax=Paenimyroides ceti TaxID=395087 RepID=A0ABT8CUZ1_9FLAO|nr:DUF349 domain-containing protein [Paenimyroides ceti]MDN3706914.1 DUF349 domain-containing protein [Paenimyroides ceti]
MLEEKNDNLPQADGHDQQTPSNHDAVEAITQSNAEESEDVSIDETSEIAVVDYENLTMSELIVELENLMNNHKVMAIKDQAEAIRKAFFHQYHNLIDEKKQVFLSENPTAADSDFSYEFPLKNKFENIYNTYRDKRSQYHKSIQDSLKGNLSKRMAIIDELKELIDNTENYATALKDIQNIRDRWKNAGPIPKDNYNHVWNNFHFHIERFYDHLHLDREARDLDFKFNLEQKQKLIERARKLLEVKDISKSFRELQTLHRIWKEEVGPVSREYREDIWNEFSEITKQLHDKREAYLQEFRVKEEANLAIKQDLIKEINAIAEKGATSHKEWQDAINKINTLRDTYFNTGKVPLEDNETTWAQFKEATRVFNMQKNAFYKDIKKDQQENLNKKLALIEKVKSLYESDDFETVTPIMKQIQEDWKKIGHVPRKYSDQIWKDFKATCNHYFDRLHAQKNESISAEMENFDKKKQYLEDLKSFELQGDHKEDLESIKKHIENWKNIGPVPQMRRHIEGKFNKILDALFDKLSMSKKEAELVKFNNRLEQLAESDDVRRIQNEFVFIQRKVDEIQAEIFQLENNIQFISSAKADNPLIKEVNKNIERHRDELNLWKDKLNHLRRITDSNK